MHKAIFALPSRLILSPLVAGFLFVVGILAVTLWLVALQNEAADRVEHTLEVEQRLSRVLRHLLDAETGQRGFLITEDPGFLQPYNRAVQQLPENLAALRRIVGRNPEQLERVNRLVETADDRMEQLAVVMQLANGSADTRLKAMQFGKGLMDSARNQIEAMRAEERRLLALREADAGRISTLLTIALLATVMALATLGWFTLRRLNQQIAALRSGRDALDTSNKQLRAEAASRAEAENQARQLQKMEAVGQLTGGIAHDFNNMLAIVIGSLDLAKRRLGKADIAKAADCIDNAVEGAQRASQLTARLMAFSRQQPLEPVTVDANELVAGMSELLRRTLGETVQVETRLATELWPCFVDAHQLENALVNLCVNGRDAMPNGGKLTIETGNVELDARYAESQGNVQPGQYVMVSVTDTGIGMPPDVAERAFDPFYTTKGVGRGTGLGLSQVHGFVTQSGGQIKIYSAPGAGTTIRLYLPRGHARSGQAAQKSLVGPYSASLPHAQDTESILVVEDDERVRQTTVDSLRELGYAVVQAADARQALAILAVQPKVHMLFTDIVMPDMNGHQLAEVVKPLWPDIKILFTTGYASDSMAEGSTSDSDIKILAKPFTISQLAHRIRQVLDQDD